MESLADNGNGSYAYVDDLDEARKLFVEDLTSTLQVIALDAKIQVDFNPDVVAYYRLIGYETRDVADDDFRNDEVDAGEIGVGHSVTALYELKFHPEADVAIRIEEPGRRRFQRKQTGDGREDGDDRHHNHQLNQGKAVLLMIG